MLTINATEAKARFAKLLRTVENGETVAITRHGATIARVVPVPVDDRTERRSAVARFRRKRETWAAAGMSVDEILAARHEGHRV